MKTLDQAREDIARDAWKKCRLQLRIFVVAGIRPNVPLAIAAKPFEELTPYQRGAIAYSAHQLVRDAEALTQISHNP